MHKKHQKRHTSRSGNSMRSLRNVKGVKVFAFPDHVWNVKGWKTRKKGTHAQKGKRFPVAQDIPRKVTKVVVIKKPKMSTKPIKKFDEKFPEKPKVEKPKKKSEPLAKPKLSSEEKERRKLEKYVRDQQERKKLEWIKQAEKEALAKKEKRLLVKKPKKRLKIKPSEPRKKLTHIEKMHLLASCKQFNIDPQEIDSKIDYYENKRHIQEMAKMKGYSEAEITSVESEQKKRVVQYEEYLHNLKNELEEAGYVITSPNM